MLLNIRKKRCQEPFPKKVPDTFIVIFNPRSNRGRSRRCAAALQAACGGLAGVRWTATTHPGHATELAAQAASEGCGAVIALGGDGTVHEVVNGLMKIEAMRRPRLGVIPIGSGNDFAFGLRLPADPREAFRRIAEAGAVCRIDVIELTDNLGRTVYAANSIGIGLDAAVTIQSRRIRRCHGLLMYVVAALRAIIQDYAAPLAALELDGRPWKEVFTVLRTGAAGFPASRLRILFLALGNGPREGGCFLTNPAARPDDGLLDAMLVGPMPRLRMLRLLPEVMVGRQARFPEIRTARFARLRLAADRPIPIHVDSVPRPNRKAVVLFVPVAQRTLDVDLEVAAGAWQTMGGAVAPLVEGRANDDGAEVRMRAFRETPEQMSMVTVTHPIDPINVGQVRVVAKDLAGREHTGGVHNMGKDGDDGHVLEWEFRDLPLKRIGSLEFQARAYERIELRDIALRPGMQTEPRVRAAAPKPTTQPAKTP
jgi:diacylglycerol kinase (ATP)